jgi:hypothetical protein
VVGRAPPPLRVPLNPVSLRYDNRMARPATTCDGPGCTNTLHTPSAGRPARFCSTACRVRAHRHRQAGKGPVTIEVDLGSATSRGRPIERAWLVRLRRGDRTVIAAHALRRPAADRLAQQLTDLLA